MDHIRGLTLLGQIVEKTHRRDAVAKKKRFLIFLGAGKMGKAFSIHSAGREFHRPVYQEVRIRVYIDDVHIHIDGKRVDVKEMVKKVLSKLKDEIMRVQLELSVTKGRKE